MIEPLVKKPDGFGEAVADPYANALQPLGGTNKTSATLDLNAGFLGGEEKTDTAPEMPQAPSIYPNASAPTQQAAPNPADTSPQTTTQVTTPMMAAQAGGGSNVESANTLSNAALAGTGQAVPQQITSTKYINPSILDPYLGNNPGFYHQVNGEATNHVLQARDDPKNRVKSPGDNGFGGKEVVGLGMSAASMFSGASTPGTAIIALIRIAGELSLGKPSVGQLFQSNINSTNGQAIAGTIGEDNQYSQLGSKFVQDTAVSMMNDIAKSKGAALNFNNVGIGDMYGYFYTDFENKGAEGFRWHQTPESAIADAAFGALEKSGVHLTGDERKQYFDQIKYDFDQVRSTMDKVTAPQREQMSGANWYNWHAQQTS